MQKYTLKEMQQKLGISRPVMLEIIRNKEIGSVRIGRRVYFTENHYRDYLARVGMEPDDGEEAAVRPGSLAMRVHSQLVRGNQSGLTAREKALIDALAVALSQ